MAGIQAHSFQGEFRASAQAKYLLRTPEGPPAAGEGWPAILFLHGAGACGDDLDVLRGRGLLKYAGETPGFPFVVAAPLCPRGEWWFPGPLLALLDDLMVRHPIDPARVYCTGVSMGGSGTWYLAFTEPARFAAIAPVCGRGNPFMAGRLKSVPAWVFHGARDATVHVSHSLELIDALEKAGAKPRWTVYSDAGHDIADRVYRDPALYEWLLQQKHGVNQACHKEEQDPHERHPR